MLRDQLAAVGDELVGAFLLGGLVIPAAGEGDFHGGRGADRAGAQEEGGVAGDHFGVGERAHIADLGLFGGELAGGDHLIQLHAGHDTGQIAALVDGSKGVVVVGQVLGVGLGAGGMAELHIRELLGGLDHEILVAEGIGEDDGAAVVYQLSSLVVALLAFGNIGLHDGGDTQLLAGSLGGVDEVQVVGGVFVVQEDEADLHLGFAVVVSAAAGAEAEAHNESQEQSCKLFHDLFLQITCWLVFHRCISIAFAPWTKKRGDCISVSTADETKRPSALLRSVDSPAIYGSRVETSKPHHLIYIDLYELFAFCFSGAAQQKRMPFSGSISATRASDSTRTPCSRIRSPPF